MLRWAAIALLLSLAASPARAEQLQVCFSPPLPHGCDPTSTIVEAIEHAHKTIRVQIYALTSRPIVSALASAKHRGVDVRVIVDRSQLRENRSDAYAVQRLAAAHIPVLVDTVPGLMHDKVMIIDGGTVLSGSFNYTWSAEHRNAENLLIISEPALAAQYIENWDARAAKSRPLIEAAGGAPPIQTNAKPPSTGPVVGNQRSMIYEWPGCPYYRAISEHNRVKFPNAGAAAAAGYRPAKNCP